MEEDKVARIAISKRAPEKSLRFMIQSVGRVIGMSSIAREGASVNPPYRTYK